MLMIGDVIVIVEIEERRSNDRSRRSSFPIEAKCKSENERKRDERNGKGTTKPRFKTRGK